MPALSRPVTILETALLRRRLATSAAERERCAHCRRTPLIGERVHFYVRRETPQLVCDLCRSRRESAPIRSGLMYPPERERAVRVVPPVA